ncbi:MAG: ABC transporter substrate-binding protein [Thaumarchaeota archaeon 13_1_40CM_4_38_7]|nr:MAG: ABC transporter substrate-binding protein [Thaumarchaeota archaeon 13_1_40CM_4_38_7]
MKLILLLILALFIFGSKMVLGDKGTYFDKVEFIQYSDDNTAIEEVKNGHLDIYYSAIPSDRLDPQSRQALSVFQSTGSTYGLLVNPGNSSDKFNPFSIREVRFALNYLVDRDLIVDELLQGYGLAMVSAYKPYDPDYLLILDELQSFDFRYNPILADNIISESLEKAGAKKISAKWYYGSNPVEITIFIRNDDQIRKSIGEVLASQLQKEGFTVHKDYGDLAKAYSVVYGSNPCDMKWNIYTEAYTMSGFVRYDSVIIAQMYSPWFGNMPGSGNPAYCNYKDDKIDSISQKIFVANFTSADERTGLMKKGVHEGINESVRIFLATKTDQFVANKKVQGIINDFGAGVTSRFTSINARDDSNTLSIGVKKIYQGAWNPIGGFADSYSQQIWGTVADSGDFRNPYTGLVIPVRSTWQVVAAGPNDKFPVPPDAIKWSPTQQKWVNIDAGMNATSKVTFHLIFGNWHNGQPMDMNDVLYGIYFTYQWGQDQSVAAKTFDSEFSPKAAQAVKTLVGIKILDKDTIEVYQNFWHFDQGEIADSAQVWPAMPWEIIYSMEKSVTDGKLSFSRSGAVSNNVDWLSLLVPKDADIIKSNLEEFKKDNLVPAALVNSTKIYTDSRYSASVSWINQHNHGIISNGPFFLDNYSPEARTITIKSFDDSTYPFGAGYWKTFEKIKIPKIESAKIPKLVSIGKELDIPVDITPNATAYYFLINSEGKIIDKGQVKSSTGISDIIIPPNKTSYLSPGANDLQIFTVSDLAYHPDIFRTSFLAINGNYTMPEEPSHALYQSTTTNSGYIVGIGFLVGLVLLYITLRKVRRKVPSEAMIS